LTRLDHPSPIVVVFLVDPPPRFGGSKRHYLRPPFLFLSEAGSPLTEFDQKSGTRTRTIGEKAIGIERIKKERHRRKERNAVTKFSQSASALRKIYTAGALANFKRSNFNLHSSSASRSLPSVEQSFSTPGAEIANLSPWCSAVNPITP
jgi:hypothetical protein